MTDPSNPPPADAAASNGPDGDPLGRLERLLAGQLSLAKRGQLDGMRQAAEEAERLLAQARALPQPFSPDQAQRLSRVLGLHRQVGLVLAQAKDELAGKLRHSARGQRTLRAYRHEIT